MDIAGTQNPEGKEGHMDNVLRSGAPLFLPSLTFPRVGLLTYSFSPSCDLIPFWFTYLTFETHPNSSQSILSHLVTIKPS